MVIPIWTVENKVAPGAFAEIAKLGGSSVLVSSIDLESYSLGKICTA